MATAFPEDVGPEDPDIFELERQEAEARFDAEPRVLTAEDVDPLDAGTLANLEFQQEQNRERLAVEATEPEPVNIDDDPAVRAFDEQSRQEAEARLNESYTPEALAAQEQALQEAATRERARQQATYQARFKQPSNGDWRVRLRLAPGANYLYQAEEPGILAPLKASDGVIFPYTPTIDTTYQAKYNAYDLVHSNYRGYFYQNSAVEAVNIRAMFTAQDTQEAEYLLAVIHFFKSATKMFYGKDSQRGAPPPLVYLYGLGQYQFNNHPCVVQTFNYNLPSDVDYIRTQPNNYGGNLLARRAKLYQAPSNPLVSVVQRLSNALLPPGATPSAPSPGQIQQSVTSNTSKATYVPTKIEISITLLPIQSRAQVSQQFSLKGFANGDLLKGGFW